MLHNQGRALPSPNPSKISHRPSGPTVARDDAWAKNPDTFAICPVEGGGAGKASAPPKVERAGEARPRAGNPAQRGRCDPGLCRRLIEQPIDRCAAHSEALRDLRCAHPLSLQRLDLIARKTGRAALIGTTILGLLNTFPLALFPQVRLELCEGCKHVEHQPSVGRGGVYGGLIQNAEAYALGVQLIDNGAKVGVLFD